MSKKVVIFDYDEYETIRICINKALHYLENIEDSYFKSSVEIELKEAKYRLEE